MSSQLSTILNKKSQFNPYFWSFTIVLVLTVFIVFYCFMTVYDKNFFKDLLQNFEQSVPTNPPQTLSPGPPWPIPVNLN